jgi:aromatic-amino-acid transaminase
MASVGLTTLIALSFSKSFSLYGERVGALVVRAPEPRGAQQALNHARLLARTSYSMPPAHGAMLAAAILDDPALAADWREELGAMRDRIRVMRHRLVERLHRNTPSRSFAFMLRQRGLFSFSGLSAAEIEQMRRNDAVYAVPDGRLCIAGLTEANVDRVADAISAAIKAGPGTVLPA